MRNCPMTLSACCGGLSGSRSGMPGGRRASKGLPFSALACAKRPAHCLRFVRLPGSVLLATSMRRTLPFPLHPSYLSQDSRQRGMTGLVCRPSSAGLSERWRPRPPLFGWHRLTLEASPRRRTGQMFARQG
jgi:hypothetical protein